MCGVFHLDWFDYDSFSTPSGYPVLQPVDVSPKRLIPFSEARAIANATPSKRKADNEAGIHFFQDDQRFAACWTDPVRYGEMLRGYECVFTPDFSMWLEMPDPIARFQVYRMALVGYIWQQMGLTVVPTLTWCRESTYLYAWESIPTGSTVALSTVGLMDCEEGIELFQNGALEAARTLHPKRILAHGKQCDFESGNAEVIWYPSETQTKFAAMREAKKAAKAR